MDDMTTATAVANGENRVAQPTPVQSASTAMIRQEPGAIFALAERSGNPMDFLSKMGESIAKSGMLGLKKTEQGSTLLMICMTEGKTPLQVISEFHVMDDGKLARKADWVISRFREMGGSFAIVDDGEDGLKATYEFTYRGNTRKVSYTIEEAKAEKIVKPDSRWTKNPSSMLRARVITKGVRMVAPEVMAGFCTEEELDGQTDGPITTTSAPRGRPPKDRTEPPTGSQPAATSAATSPSVAPQQPAGEAGEVIDAEFERTSDAAEPAVTEEVPFDAGKAESPNKPATANSPEFKKEATILDIEFQLGRLGMSRDDYEKARFSKFNDSATLDGLPQEKLDEALLKVRKAADAQAAKN